MSQMLAQRVERFGSHQFGKSVIGIVMIHCARGYEFVLDENRWRNRTLIEDVKTDSNQVFPVPFGKVRHRTDKSRFGLTQFGSALG